MKGRQNPLPVWTLSLGCAKNRVDTEKLLGSLGPVRAVASPAQSRLALINTCGFIEPALRESIRAILDAAAEIGGKKRRPLLAVAGCMVGRYGAEELSREMPEVDLWLPTADMAQWPAMLARALGLAPGAPGRLLSTPKSYAWLKIAEGCRHQCAFCAIPQIRGRLFSTPAEALLEEAASIPAKELCLIAQDTASWGRDLPGAPKLRDLLPRLCELPGPEWIRLLYLYPAEIDVPLLQTMRGLAPKVLPYLDIPIQHSHPQILASMGRPFAGDPARVLELARSHLPDCALRTTVIVGYPGETDAHFRHLCDFVRETRFTHLGIFTYFAEEGTKAASLPNQVPQKVKEERRGILAAIQAEISRQNLAALAGSRQMALVDSPNPEWPGLFNARLWFQAPEVDGITYLSAENAAPGDLLPCSIEDTYDYDLSALQIPPGQ